MIDKCYINRGDQRRLKVTFHLPATLWTESIHLVGDFNDWNQTSHPLEHNRFGIWMLTVELEVGRVYQFRYLRDGKEWFNDTQADAYVYNQHGSSNFVVVTDPTFQKYIDGGNVQVAGHLGSY
ncbi:glycoside hydrolase family 13 [bacterium]|nr:glycoside hydrolase family 13 [bacterium]